MPRLLITLSFLFFSLTFTAIQVFGQDITVCDYVAAQNELTTLNLSGSYHQFDDRYADDRNNIDNGDLLLRGLKWMDSPMWGYRVEGSVNLQYSSTTVTADYALNSSSDFRRYLTEQAFVFGGADSTGSPLQSGFSVRVLGGGGYGRFQNVSPLAKVFAIMRFLQDREVIENNPADDTMIELAQFIDESETPGLSAEVLSELELALETQLELPTVIALDALLRDNISRFCGWDATMSVGYELINPENSPSPVLRAAANYATAVGPLGQIVANAHFTAPLSLQEGFVLNGEFNYVRTLSPIASFSMGYQYSGVSTLDGDDMSLMSSHTLNGSVRAQVSSALSVLFKGQASHSTGFEEPEWSLDISFDYALF